MRVGAQVSTAGGLPAAIPRAEAMKADVVQIFCLNPRTWRPPRPSEEAVAEYRAAAGRSRVTATFCHAPYLINLATADEELTSKSLESLVDNLAVATAIGAEGVIVHVGSHLGRGLEAVLGQLSGALCTALDRASTLAGGTSCALLLENTAGAGGTIGRTFDELATVLEASGDDRLGVCLDTQHLFASGVAYETDAEADAVVESIDAAIGLGRLACMHLNDSKVPLGSNRDRHENLGEGAIGRSALGALCSHPKLSEVPAILEVPGVGKGPTAADVASAKRILAAGSRKRKA